MNFGKSKSSKTDSKPPQENSQPADAPQAIQPLPVSAQETTANQNEAQGDATLREVAAGIVEPGAAPLEDVQERLSKLKEENASLFDQLLRKQAEFENFRKRTEREKAEFMRFANFEIVRDLLPVLDGFERALKVETSGSLEGFKKGMELVYKQLFDGLRKAGLEPLETVGQKFDPNFHQAVAHDERGGIEDNVVIEEFQRGYLFQGRLLRAAMVKVVSTPKNASAEGEASDEPVVQ